MSSIKLKRHDPSQKEKEKIIEERFENIQLFFTISFILSDSLMIFDIVANVIYPKPVESYFYMRFLVTFFGLYGTMIMIGGNFCRDYFDIEFTCCCGKICENIFSLYGCHVFFGGLFLIISYCIELCSIKLYYDNKDLFEEELIKWLLYLLFIFSSITMIMLCFLIINMKTQKKIKKKYE